MTEKVQRRLSLENYQLGFKTRIQYTGHDFIASTSVNRSIENLGVHK